MLAELTERARSLDQSDPLRSFRDRFSIPTGSDGAELIYLVGNSLGLQPKSTHSFVSAELEKWRRLGVLGHFHGEQPWLTYHDRVRETVAELAGALGDEVVVMNSLTINLHLMLATFFRPSGRKSSILMEAGAFPSDRYAVASRLILDGFSPAGHLIELRPRAGEDVLRTEDIVRAIEEQPDRIALILLGGLNYYSGQLLDMQTITAAAHRFDIPIGFDLAHAIGNVPLRLHDCDCDFAVWCSYKYLNAGPGAVAGCFISERHARDRTKPRMAGWWGHELTTRFEMPPDFSPPPSAEGWQVSGPPILQLAALRASLEIFEDAGKAAVFEKGRRLNLFMREVLNEVSGPYRVITPSEPGAFGCQLSLLFREDAQEICDGLESNGVVCDYREPDVIRVAAAPLYNSFHDAVRFGEILNSLCK